MNALRLRRFHQGFTLAELMITLAVAAIALGGASHAFNDMLPRYRVSSAAAMMHGLIRKARADAISHGNQMICDGLHGCGHFGSTRLIWVGYDKNGDNQLSDTEIREHYQLPSGTQLVWRRFKGNALKFHNRGNAHFQNGSFYICNKIAARRIVMNWIGRPRVEDANPDDCD